MTVRGVDYSMARPGGAAIKAAGFAFAMRYLGDDSRCLTTQERDDLHANGVAIGLVFESTANRALAGKAAGMSDASFANRAAAELGLPRDRPIYFAVDFDSTPEQQPAIDAYLDGAAFALTPERVGVYGSYYVVKRCFENQSARWFWQTYAWSGGQVFGGAHLIQDLNGQTLNGGEVDYNTALQPDYGQWPHEEEEDMTEVEKLLVSTWGAAGEQSLAWEERVTNARYRRDKALAGVEDDGSTPFSPVAARIEEHIAAHPGGASGVPKGTRLSVEVV